MASNRRGHHRSRGRARSATARDSAVTANRRMRIGVHLGHWEKEANDVVGLAREAESLGFDSAWVSETWGSDGVALASAIASGAERIGIGTGILQMPGRTPAMAAMSALTIDH